MNNNLLIYTRIEDGDWSLSSNYGKKGYYIPCLSNEKMEFNADNSNWIIEELYKNLKILLSYKKAINLNFEVIINAIKFELEDLYDVEKEDYQIIVDLIEQGIELNFFKEHYDKKDK